MSVEASLGVAEEVVKLAEVPVVAGVATAFGCPYSGDVSLDRLLFVVDRLVGMGIAEIGLADTTGMANPLQVERTVACVLDRFGDRATFSLHFHNTRGMGLANAVAGLRSGINV